MPPMHNHHKDYYQILGITQGADAETLKRAYRRQAKKFHPDHRPEDASAEEQFKEVQEAYEVLRDPRKRLRYDSDFFEGNGGRESKAGATHGSVSEERASKAADFAGDVFEHLKERMESRGKRGVDLRYHLTLTLEDAALGVSKVIQIPKTKICSSCEGRGWIRPGNTPVCGLCRGEGEITVSGGTRRIVQPCPGCDGKGLVEKTPCDRCKGKGTTLYRLRRRITVPQGVDNGTRLKVRGEGEQGEKGGEQGDLYIVIQIEDHPVFTRRNLDLCCEIPIRFTQAVLGAQIRVPTLQGERELTIPPGTQSGTVFRLEGCGFPGLHGSRVGDQSIRVVVEVPRKVSKKERQMLEAWERLHQS